jgi:hypothetical protein
VISLKEAIELKTVVNGFLVNLETSTVGLPYYAKLHDQKAKKELEKLI